MTREQLEMEVRKYAKQGKPDREIAKILHLPPWKVRKLRIKQIEPSPPRIKVKGYIRVTCLRCETKFKSEVWGDTNKHYYLCHTCRRKIIAMERLSI